MSLNGRVGDGGRRMLVSLLFDSVVLPLAFPHLKLWVMAVRRRSSSLAEL